MTTTIRQLLGLTFLLVARSATAAAYDGEDDIGLVAEDRSPEVAARNTQLLNAALDAQWAGGKFTLRNGKTGPVLGPIEFRGKEFYFAGTVATAKRFGGSIRGAGGRVPYMPSEHYREGGTLGGSTTRFTRIDGEKGGAVLRLCGCGMVVSGIEFRGRPYEHDPTGEGPDGDGSHPKGTTRTPVGIEIEGRTMPPTGWHTIRDCSVFSCVYGVCCRRGHYDPSNKFVTEETHADQSTIDGMVFTDVDSCWRTENQQAVNWSIRDIALNGIGGKGLKKQVVFDIARGTGIFADNVAINSFQTTLIRLASEKYTPWANTIVVKNVKWDRAMALVDGSYAKIIQYDGPEKAGGDVADAKWHIRIDGNFSYDRWWVKKPVDVSRLIDIPKFAERFPLNNILLDIEGLDRIVGYSDKFEPVGGGPWVRPKSEWVQKE